MSILRAESSDQPYLSYVINHYCGVIAEARVEVQSLANLFFAQAGGIPPRDYISISVALIAMEVR